VAESFELEVMDNNGSIAEEKFELVAAIDFGTTYSGYAYSYSFEPETIYVNSKWPSGIQTCKEATAILFNDKQQFVAFGEDAISRYSDYLDTDEEKTFYFFSRFKMILYKEKVNMNNHMCF